MSNLNFKTVPNFESGKMYSVCLRGARSYDKTKPISIFTNNQGAMVDSEFSALPSCEAFVISNNQYIFESLNDSDCLDNYDFDAKTKDGLLNAMNNVYTNFDTREIVTILKFKIL